jgi:hypothetical protein
MVLKAKKNHQQGDWKNRLLNFSMLFFAVSIMLAVFTLNNSANAGEPTDDYGPVVENCYSKPDSFIYAYATDCTGVGAICVDTECPDYPNPTGN